MIKPGEAYPCTEGNFFPLKDTPNSSVRHWAVRWTGFQGEERFIGNTFVSFLECLRTLSNNLYKAVGLDFLGCPNSRQQPELPGVQGSAR